MKELIFKPFIPQTIMLVLCLIMLIVVLINRKSVINRILIIVILYIISQRPMLLTKSKDSTVFDSSMFDITFVIDRTISMNAIDVNNDTRLNAAKKDCYKIIKSFKDAYFNILVFDKNPEILYPLTKELDIIDALINDMDVVNPNYINNQVSLNVPYEELKNYLETPKRNDEAKKIVFFISDGEINSSDTIDLDFSQYRSIAHLIDNGAVLGYGTENGAKMLIKQQILQRNSNIVYVDKNGYLLDGTQTAISKYNGNNLKKLADNMKIQYLHVDNQSVIDNLINNLVDEYKPSDNEKELEKDLYYYFSYVLLFLLYVELFNYKRSA